jgi:hypothetical protein
MKQFFRFFMALFLVLVNSVSFGQNVPVYKSPMSHGLPFIEMWDQGTFNYNEWFLVPEYTNWSVNTGIGNPSPSADFSKEPLRTNYSLTLETPELFSGYFVSTTIWCDFDIKLINLNGTGDEKLFMDVFHNGIWINKAWISNTESKDWTSKHVALIEASDTTFKVRFRAEGKNSANIQNWYVDNINIYMKCNPPVDVSLYNSADREITLTWSEPEGNIEGPVPQWLHWDDGINADAVGTCGNCSWDVAARWDASQLTELEGGFVTKISFFPCSSGYADYRIRVWQGANASTLLVDQPVPSVTIDQWNTVEILNPVPIDITQDLWIGYNSWEYWGMEAGCDTGPAFDGYGDMFCWAGIWYSMHEYTGYIDRNWNIQGYVETLADNKPDSNFFIGYNLYRSDDNKVTYNKLNATPIADTNYVDPVPGYQVYCYYVTSLFEIDYGVTCESDSSNVTCADIVNVINALNNGTVSIYPNPAKDNVVIKSDYAIRGVELLNLTGQTVFTLLDPNEKSITFSTSALEPGVYFARITSAKESTIKKISIVR